MKTIIFTVGAVTYAIKARRLLTKTGIRSKLVKLNAERTAGGCIYGIEVSDKDYYSTIAVLKEAQIGYTIWGPEVKK